MSSSLPAAKLQPVVWPWRLAANLTTVSILALGLLALLADASRLRVLVLMAAATGLDGLDGWLARRAGGPRLTGALLDLAADMTAFGFAPAALVASLWPDAGWLLLAALGVYLCASLARLARSCRHFAHRPPHGYIGLPMPACGWLLASLALTIPSGLALSAAILGIGALAISRRRYPSPAWLWRQLRRPALVAVLAAGGTTALTAWPTGLLVLSLTYALYPLVWPLASADGPSPS